LAALGRGARLIGFNGPEEEVEEAAAEAAGRVRGAARAVPEEDWRCPVCAASCSRTCSRPSCFTGWERVLPSFIQIADPIPGP